MTPARHHAEWLSLVESSGPFLSMPVLLRVFPQGLMQAIRNPHAHETALDWPISKDDAMDILSFISFLWRQLDKAVFFKP